ncbi:hypothetical protein D3C71_1195190 [compost metagenome]
MQPAGGGDHRIDLADAFKQRLHAGIVGQIDLGVAAVAAGADQLVVAAQGGGHGLAQGAAGADEKDLHA